MIKLPPNTSISGRYIVQIEMKSARERDDAVTVLEGYGCLLNQNSPSELLAYYEQQQFKRGYVISLSPKLSNFTLTFEFYPLGESGFYVMRRFLREYTGAGFKSKKISAKSIEVTQASTFGHKNLHTVMVKPVSYYLKWHLLPLLTAFGGFGLLSAGLNFLGLIDLKFAEIWPGALLGTAMTIFYAWKGDSL